MHTVVILNSRSGARPERLQRVYVESGEGGARCARGGGRGELERDAAS